MASDSGAWLDERRSWGIVSAVAASVVGAMSLIELDEVFWRDIVTVVAAVGVYLVYGAVPRFPAWAPFGVAFVAAITMNTPELRTEGAMFFVVLALSHLALNEPRRPIVFVCGVTAIAVPAIVAAFRWHRLGLAVLDDGIRVRVGVRRARVPVPPRSRRAGERPCRDRRPGRARRAATHRA